MARRTAAVVSKRIGQAGEPSLPWLVLIHQLPPTPAYLRVKIWRRLQALGALALKNAVYVLPCGEQGREDLSWVRREIEEGGGEATISESRFVEGVSDARLRAMFNAARDAEYAELAAEVRAAAGDPASAGSRRQIARLKRRLAQVAAVDFFGAPGRDLVEGLIAGLEASHERDRSAGGEPSVPPAAYRGRVWVTRRGINVDRIASAWLVRRFIDPGARFRFVADGEMRADPSEVRFDMFEAEFTHVGDRCTFEILLERFALGEPALRRLAELVHDLDLKDGKFGCDETPGVGAAVAGIVAAHGDDEQRLVQGAALFDALLAHFRSRPR